MIDTTSLRSNAYLRDVLHQPTALHDTLHWLAGADLAPVRSFAARLASGELRRMVLTGMGSSGHALHPLYLHLIARGLNVQLIETSELLHHTSALLAPDSLVVAVSQSGQSIEISQLLDCVAGRVPLVAVTNSADNPLALRADTVLVTQAGPEATVSCKTYTASLMALEVLSRLLTGGEASPVLAELGSLPEAVEHYLSDWQAHIEEAREALSGIRYLILTGRGASLAAARTGALIIKEAARFPTEGMSSAAFRHGPFEMTSPELFVLVYEGNGPTAKLNAGLCNDVRAAGGRGALAGRTAQAGMFALPDSPSALLPVLEILPAQMISMALAMMDGHEPGVFQRATKVTTAE